MKKGILFGLVIGIALMGALYAIPALAHGPSATSGGGNTGDIQGTGSVWNQMWDACQSGDWDAMNQIHSQFCGSETTTPNNTNTAPNQSSNSFWDEMNDYMGERMMGGSGSGWGGMMGGGMMGMW